VLEVTAGGELILAGGTGNGYRLAELMGATNPSCEAKGEHGLEIHSGVTALNPRVAGAAPPMGRLASGNSPGEVCDTWWPDGHIVGK